MINVTGLLTQRFSLLIVLNLANNAVFCTQKALGIFWQWSKHFAFQKLIMYDEIEKKGQQELHYFFKLLIRVNGISIA
jgi:hypothetical protein